MQQPSAGIIIGAGLAGLTAALALRQRGIAATVYEAAPAVPALGPGLWLAPNAMQVFARLGLAARIETAGVPLHAFELVDKQMRPLLHTSQARLRAQFGYGTTAIGWATLRDILLEAVGPATVQLGQACTGLQADSTGVTATFADGRTVRAGFGVAADGLHSSVRQALFPGARPSGRGHVVWRGRAAMQLAPHYKRASREVWHAGLRFGFSETADGVVEWFAAVPASFNGERPGLLHRLQRAFDGFGYPVPAILEAAPEPAISGHEVLDLAPLPAWHAGRVGLIGDAAHAATPYLGQGACQAVEDAYALAQCLTQNPTDPAAAFAALHHLRHAKARHVTHTARLVGRVGYWRGPAAALRNLALRVAPQWLTERQLGRMYGLEF